MRKQKRALCGVLVALVVLSPTAFATRMVIPSGMPIGVRMTAEGVVVCGMTEIQTAAGERCPAEKAGLRSGDILYSVNGSDISSGEEFAQEVQDSGGKAVVLEGERDDVKIRVTVQPVQSKVDQEYHLGLLVRDSMAGIGTVTYIDPENGGFGALGHAVCEVDSGTKLPLEDGSLMPASVVGVNVGTRGNPGQLLGAFAVQETLGEISKNTNTGIFGVISPRCVKGKEVPVAQAEEVTTGKAEIITCISGTTPKRYDITIERLTRRDERTMVIRVTDDELLKKTGGIVQGMSGSPIIQDGKLVGAVTHVLVNDPTRGYGIFIENMLDSMR